MAGNGNHPTASNAIVAGSSAVQAHTWNQLTTILVGPGEQQFLVHTKTLRRVPFFQKCLDSGMIESQENLIRLPEDDAEAFSEIVQWIYNGALSFKVYENVRCTSEYSKRYLRMMQIHLLARKLCIEELQNSTIDDLLDVVDGTAYSMDTTQLDLVMATAVPGDPIYQVAQYNIALLIQLSAHWDEVTEDRTYTDFIDTSPENLRFALRAMHAYQSVSETFKKGRCRLHIHVDTPVCPVPKILSR